MVNLAFSSPALQSMKVRVGVKWFYWSEGEWVDMSSGMKYVRIGTIDEIAIRRVVEASLDVAGGCVARGG